MGLGVFQLPRLRRLDEVNAVTATGYANVPETGLEATMPIKNQEDLNTFTGFGDAALSTAASKFDSASLLTRLVTEIISKRTTTCSGVTRTSRWSSESRSGDVANRQLYSIRQLYIRIERNFKRYGCF